MAAGQAAEQGVRVLVVEKMPKAGLKLGLTGKGRCNLTNTADLPEFVKAFGSGGRFLRPAFFRFFSSDLRDFFYRLGVETLEERGGRVFPVSENARLLADTLISWVQSKGVCIRTRSRVLSIESTQGRVQGIRVSRQGTPVCLSADRVILCTGGASYPGTGSTGDGYDMCRTLGHTVNQVYPALVPLEVKELDVVKQVQGLSLRNVQASAMAQGKLLGRAFGEMLFTHFGLSGPIVLTLSQTVVESLKQGQQVRLHIDLKPALDHSTLDARLIRDFRSQGSKQVKTILKGLLPQSLIPICLQQTGLNRAKPGSQVSAQERQALRLWLKDVPLTVTGHRSFAEAIVTAGGVSIREVDPRNMQSKRLRGLHLAGEVLDIAAGTGGYNLQAAFSTGWLAGQCAGSQISQSELQGPRDPRNP